MSLEIDLVVYSKNAEVAIGIVERMAGMNLLYERCGEKIGSLGRK